MLTFDLKTVFVICLCVNYLNCDDCERDGRIALTCPDGTDKSKYRCCFSVVPGERDLGLYCCDIREYQSLNIDDNYEDLISTEEPTAEPWV